MTSLEQLVTALGTQVQAGKALQSGDLVRLQKKYRRSPTSKRAFFTKAEIWAQVQKAAWWAKLASEQRKQVARFLQVKPIRTQSGVATVTILTKPWPCPGKCIFCPADVRMPKSYLANEPGAQRAELNFLDPYLQVNNRLQTLQQMGHKLDKVEVIVLGGTWDAYPDNYQRWFVKEVYQALNDFADEEQKRLSVIRR
ncbi:histone acetyltransferase, partial [bacterium]|nr:histone acetyltransferase [bacterium]